VNIPDFCKREILEKLNILPYQVCQLSIGKD